jgi:hypothetical protein
MMFTGNLDLVAKGQYAREICQTIRVPPPPLSTFHHNNNKEQSGDINARIEPSPTSTNQNVLYLLRPPPMAEPGGGKAATNGKKSLLLCLPRRMATKAVFDALNRAYGMPCASNNNKTTSSSGLPKTLENSNAGNYSASERCLAGDFDSLRSVLAAEEPNLLSVVFTRHPFDRIILGYRHSKNATSGAAAAEFSPARAKGAGRSLLYAHPRLLGANKKRTGKRNQFLDFVKTQVSWTHKWKAKNVPVSITGVKKTSNAYLQ